MPNPGQPTEPALVQRNELPPLFAHLAGRPRPRPGRALAILLAIFAVVGWLHSIVGISVSVELLCFVLMMPNVAWPSPPMAGGNAVRQARPAGTDSGRRVGFCAGRRRRDLEVPFEPLPVAGGTAARGAIRLSVPSRLSAAP